MKKSPPATANSDIPPHRPPSSISGWIASRKGRGRNILITSVAFPIVLTAILAWAVLTSQHQLVSQSALKTSALKLTTSNNALTTQAQSVPQVEPPRRDSTMAYDPRHHMVLLFGGQIEAIEGPETNQTWAWNGHGWKQLHPASSPPALQGKMVYDAASQRIILFLNQVKSGGIVANEMWAWDGATWQQLHPAVMPEVLGASIAYDEERHQIVLFGGAVPSGRFITYMNTTWTWNGTTWQQQHPATSPSPRTGAAMAYDAVHQQIVLFGGATLNGYSSETWTWNGTIWQLHHVTGTPPVDQNVSLVYDSVTRQTLLFGMTSSDTTWAWNGTGWVSVAAHGAPTALFQGAAAYNIPAQSVIVYAIHGNAKSGATPVSQTWTWNGKAWMQMR